jgi:hypothetical protein
MAEAKLILEQTSIQQVAGKEIRTESYRLTAVDPGSDAMAAFRKQLRKDFKYAKVGEKHPKKGDSGEILYCVDVKIGSSRGSNDATAVARFEGLPAGQVIIGAALRQFPVTRDRQGPIKVGYKKGAKGAVEPPKKLANAPANLKHRGAQVQHTIKENVITFITHEPISPALEAHKYNDAINSDPTPFFTAANDDDGEKYTWQASIQGQTQDGGKTYIVTRSFEYSAIGHNPVAEYIDPTTGSPPSDITHPKSIKPGSRGNGTYVCDNYPQVSFRKVFNSRPEIARLINEINRLS